MATKKEVLIQGMNREELKQDLLETRKRMAGEKWREVMKESMGHMEDIYNAWSLNVVRTTALVGALDEHKKGATGEDLGNQIKDEWSVLSGEHKAFVYGEVSVISLAYVLHTYCSEPHLTNFYDLGSGTGRAVLATAMNANFRKLVGVELLEGLHSISQKAVHKYNTDVRPKLDQSKQQQQISTVCGDFLRTDWSDGEVLRSDKRRPATSVLHACCWAQISNVL
ncbi:hypothetical protein CYMTET_30411 [Cymbomonas tetramitiformis]|uniref:Histone-lysine N-methyltransferase, H3 lysine-79 specific n=1 Tax=Cymbomonas tetramitiformis TaxID=36881 RepID=A0AAE0FIW6_9CHLO|nr:hypothetical protein CYMTET_30411 [Cymbomonas tetramitiformis]